MLTYAAYADVCRYCAAEAEAARQRQQAAQIMQHQAVLKGAVPEVRVRVRVCV